ncbi:MAG: carboxypeptidase regulatory-like domain-containing protein [Acidobacteriia bacterium]|nr:carboxypeptidase regulatory-like domain-containing protein [Terriglobia bacterium]
MRFLLASLLACSIYVPLLPAQSAGTGALTGTVTDASGAVVPNVTVTVINKETNQTRSTITAPDGIYKFALLPPGTYQVRFNATGFRGAEVPSVTVNVTETPVLDRVLEVGTQSEQVLVEAEAAVLQTQNSTLGTAVGSQTVTSLPLTTRNYTQILSMSAGANVSVNNASLLGKGSQDVSVNGANINQNNYQMDGVNIDNFAGTGLGADAGIYVGIGIPNPDALQEFKIQTSTYDASYGRNPGANVNVVTKSGTNSYHGSLFEFFRNTDLNSVDFFRNRSGGSRQVLNQNQFGGTIGLPIKKDKLFFFFSYQESRQINGVGTQGYSTPTLPPIPAGDRSNTTAFRAALGAAMCPANHPGDSRFQTVAGGVQVACDGSNLNSSAIVYLQAKLPNGNYYIPGSGTANFGLTPFSLPAHFTEHQAVANLDYLLTSKNTLAARFFTTQDPELISFSNTGLVEVPGTPANGLYANTNGVLKLTSIIGNNMVNEGRVSFQRNLAAFSDTDPFTNAQFGITPINPAIPVVTPMTIAGQMNLGGGIGDDVFDPTNQFQVSDTVSWSHDRHTIRAGFEYEHVQWDITYKGIERGGLTFQSFPDFLIGRAGCAPGDPTCSPSNPGNTTGSANSSISQCLFCVRSGPTGIVHGYRTNNYDWFVQDDFKATSRLTLNMGVRWEYDGTLSDVYGNLTNVWTSQLLTVPVPPSSPVPTGNSLVGYVVPSNFSKFYGQPPAGVYQSSRTLPVQSGPPFNNFGPRFGFAWQPLASGKLVVRGGGGMFYDRVGGNQFVHSVEQGNPYAVTLDYGGSGANPFSLQTPFPTTPLEFVPRWVNFQNLTYSNLNLPFIQQVLHTPLTRQYNLTFQYEFVQGWVLELGFVGSSGINQTDYNHNENAAQLASPSNPVNGIITNTVQNVFLRVPYLGYQPAGLQGTGFDGVYNYSSLQATVRKQLSHGITFQGAYTWSKNLTDLEGYGANWNNPGSLWQQYGNAYFNRPQRFVFSYSWTLPFGRHSGFTGKLTDGWTLSGVTVAQAGTPLTFTDAKAGTIYGISGTNSNTPGLTSVTFGAVNYGRAEICPGASYGSISTSGGVESRLGGASGGPGFFNATTFCPAPVIGNGTDFGDSGVGIVRGPGQFNFDASLAKMTRISERHSVQLRVEFFNALNHPQFNNPGTAISTPTTFGVITSESVNPRLIQFALKYAF